MPLPPLTVPPPPPSTLHGCFAAQAERTPAAVAVACGDDALSYADLEESANRLAHRLVAIGVGPETLVGVCLERGVDVVVALLAVLKAGGAYVPLDPAHPAARRAIILADSRAPVVVTHLRLRDDLVAAVESTAADAPAATPRLVCLDDRIEAARIAGCPSAAPEVATPPDGLAYVLYTSGSTGRPKGVMVEHRHVVHTLTANGAAFGLRSGDVMPVIASFAFDIVLFELFGPLLSGGTARIVGRDEILDLPRFVERLAGCTALHTLPSLMHEVVAAVRGRGDGVLAGMRRVFVGGEAVPAALLVDMRRAFPNARLTVLYGPTECAIVCSKYDVPPIGDDDAAGERCIGNALGRPLAGVTLALWDDEGNCVADPGGLGAVGEVVVAGPTVSRGYLGRVDLTAERFRLRGGRRWYRTGDLARRRPDGTMVFAGRADDQVKLRGFRIELGDIEAALLGHPSVAQAVVVVREDPGIGRHLIGYWVADEVPAGDLPRAAALRAFVGAALPDYMVPSFICRLDALPVTANGKIDRAVLPEPVRQPAAPSNSALPSSAPDPGERDAPRDDVERTLAELWHAVLGRADFGTMDAFLDVGGNSLTAAQLLIRIHEAFGVDPGIRALFEAPTLAGMAQSIRVLQAAPRPRPTVGRPTRPPALGDGKQTKTDDSGTLPQHWGRDRLANGQPGLGAARGASEDPRVATGDLFRAATTHFPLSPAQERLWFLDQLEPGSPLYNIAQAQRLRGPLDPDALDWALHGLVARHPGLRTRFVTAGGQAAQVVDAVGAVTMERIDLGSAPAAERLAAARRHAAWEARRPFDLARGPLLRLTLLRLADDDHVLLLCVHHIVFDGWSAGVFDDELAALYAERIGAGAAELPPLTVTPADLAVAQRDGLAGGGQDAERAFWAARLAGVTPVAMPADRPRPTVQRFDAAAAAFEIAPATVAAVAALARGARSTPFMVLLAAYAAWLARTAGQADVTIGAPIAQRDTRSAQRVIGFLVNSLALRCDVGGAPTFGALLASVRETCLAAYAHQTLPFDRVVEAVNPPRDAGRHPLFQVFFALQNAPTAERGWPNVTVEPLPVPIHASPFELALNLAPRPDGGMDGLLHFRLDLYEPATAARYAAEYAAMLGAVVADPDAALAPLPGGAATARLDAPARTVSGPNALGPAAAPIAPTVSPPAAVPVAPRDPLEADLAARWAELLALPSVGALDSFFDLGGHSLLAARLLAQLREAYGVDVPVAAFFQAPTVAALADRLRGAPTAAAVATSAPIGPPGVGAAASAALVALQREGTRPPLFCVHALGGHVLTYRPLARALGPDQPFYGLQAPSLVDPALRLDRVDAMARAYVQAVRTVQPHGPYRLAGWSMGGTVAVAMADLLLAAGERVEAVLLIDSAAPGEGRMGDSAAEEAAFLVAFGAELARRAGAPRPALDAARLAARDPEARVGAFVAAVLAAGAVPSDWGRAELGRIVQACQANAAAMARHRPAVYGGDLTLLRAENAPAMDVPDGPRAPAPPDRTATSDASPALPPDLGWSRLTARPLEIIDVPGDHERCLEAPHVAVLAAAIRDRLDRGAGVPTTPHTR